MKDDDKKAQGGAARAPVVRSTAPAGTPAARAASPYDALAPRRVPSDRPVRTLTPPRTVGGQTARLNLPDVDPGVDPGAPIAPAPETEPAPPSRTVGGTMRLAPAPTIDPPIPDVDWDSKPAPAPAPPRSPPAPASPPPPTAPSLALAPVAAASSSGEGARVDWFSPLPVAVGLVFFGVGSMLGLTIDGRVRASAPAAQAAASPSPAAPASLVAPVKAAPTAPTAPIAAGPSATAPVSATARPLPPPRGAGQAKRPGPKLPF